MGMIRFTQQQRDVLWAAALSYRTELQDRVLDGEGTAAATDLAVLERAMEKLLGATPDYVEAGETR